MKPKTSHETLIDEFCRHYCIVCKKKISVFCGTPVVHIGGCCCGVDDDEAKTTYIRPVVCHFHCYLKKKCRVKTKWNFADVKKVLSSEMKR